MPPPKRIFIGSAQADATHVDTLKKHLKLYERQNLIQIWDESMIIPGEIRNSKIEQELHAAEIILLLFSADLLAEDFIWGTEMNKILEKVKRKEVHLIPILLRSSTFADTPFAAYAAVPDREKPISNYSNKDEAWTIVVEQIKRSIQHTSNTTTSHQNPEPEMIPQTLIDEVNNLIGKGHSDKALDAIIRWAHANNQSQLKSDASIIKSGLETLKRNEMLGMLSFAEAARETAKINYSLMNLLKADLTPSKTIEPPIAVPPVVSSTSNDKFKILMLTANPSGNYQLELEKEHSRITKKLQEKTEQFSLKVHHAVNNTEFKELNETTKPDILHFSGHGQLDGIMLQNDDKNGSKLLTAKALDALFEYFIDEGILFKAVVLNACYSEEQAKAIANHVPYVIASTTEISDEAAIAFSVGFYFKLDAQGGNIEQSFRSGRTQAVTAGAEKAYFALFKGGEKIEA